LLLSRVEYFLKIHFHPSSQDQELRGASGASTQQVPSFTMLLLILGYRCGKVGLRRLGGLQWYGVRTKFGGNCLVGSEVEMAITQKYGRRQTHIHTQHSNLIRITLLLRKGIWL
jgi:hypothetical protein